MSTTPIIKYETHVLHTKYFDEARVYVFDISESSPITCMVFGNFNKITPLVRIHSQCFYSEVLGSLDCDCREQIELAYKMIKNDGAGVFMYLEQEGRGCGLISKAKAYSLKENEGLDTVEAYRAMGLDVDPRRYDNAAEILRFLGLNKVRLLTNNPRKASGLAKNGIEVEEVRIRVKPTPLNLEYLMVKQKKLGHDLGLNGRVGDKHGIE